MPDLSSRIRASAFPVVFVTMAGMVTANAWLASNERTTAGRVEVAGSEARKARDELAAEQARNAARHAASLDDRVRTKGELKAAADLAASLKKKLDDIEARLKALEAKGQP